MTSHTRSRVAFNTVIGTVAQLATSLVGLVTTPVILRQLGTTDYGAFALVGSLSTYFGLLDFGIGGSLIRFMAFYHERGDRQRIGAYISFGLLFYLALGLLLMLLPISAAPALARWLELPPALQGDFPRLLAIVLALWTGWAVVGLPGGRLVAGHRLDVTAMANVCGSLVLAGLVWTVLPLSPTIDTVFGCLAGQLATVALIMVIGARRLGGPLLASPFRLRRQEMRELFSFGFWSQLFTISSIVNMEADKVIISRGVGVDKVTPYQVANRLALLSRALPLQLLSSLFPSITAQVSQGMGPDELKALYAQVSRNLMVPTLVTVGFVVGGADALLRLWLGQHLAGAAPICAALVASYAVNNATGAGTIILRAQGRPQLETCYGIVSALLNIALTIAFIRPYGLQGVVLGTIGGNVAGSTLFIVLFHRRERFSWWKTMGRWLIRLVAATVATGLAVHLFLERIVPTTTSRLTLLAALTVGGLGYLVLYYGIGQLFAVWTVEDRALLARIGRSVRRRRWSPDQGKAA